ncbi:Hypothetical Protein CTN_1017 [Thermotoga neapolitana DSM 4359]|uniref:Uncharacterized protein n=1 Tax=Thermotoga neapolitana (strain ATCC 49049 / DSM 4359 / NBRC 107923 / NS-E) TaxID=309803 RepID=B9K8B0_THENN|nr:Hypothetical Protein CTN_1017 [Thermotoga neapolitana DSM 4359]
MIVFWINLADNINSLFPSDYLAVLTSFLHRSSHFHITPLLSLLWFFSINDSPSGEIVHREFDNNTITRYQPYEMLSHPAGHVGQNLMTIV